MRLACDYLARGAAAPPANDRRWSGRM